MKVIQRWLKHQGSLWPEVRHKLWRKVHCERAMRWTEGGYSREKPGPGWREGREPCQAVPGVMNEAIVKYVCSSASWLENNRSLGTARKPLHHNTHKAIGLCCKVVHSHSYSWGLLTRDLSSTTHCFLISYLQTLCVSFARPEVAAAWIVRLL